MAESETIGIVTNCETMNIREEPSLTAKVICFVPAGTEVMVSQEKPLSGFYKVCTAAGIEGYCMKPFIKFKEEQGNE